MMTETAKRNRRKVRVGRVIADKMDKSIIVRVDRTMRHPVYQKTFRTFSKLYAHDEKNQAAVGDTVRVMETRPLSRSKRWRLVEIVRKAE
ncbi:MAG TPA: 30S ribosomal protein S17 [Candidatus Deferrimicrobium sp.]|nr:30S ribosomal protein S17 [Candidatus Deferrimicrobium sp.]